MKQKPVVLMILDGYGLNDNPEANAIVLGMLSISCIACYNHKSQSSLSSIQKSVKAKNTPGSQLPRSEQKTESLMVRCQGGAGKKFEGYWAEKAQNAITQTSPGKIGENCRAY